MCDALIPDMLACATGRYIVTGSRPTSPSSRTSLAMPTISIAGSSRNTRMWRPSAGLPLNIRRANCSFTTATGAVPARSRSSKPRPAPIGMPIVLK